MHVLPLLLLGNLAADRDPPTPRVELPWAAGPLMTIDLLHRGEVETDGGKKELWSHKARLTGRFTSSPSGLSFRVAQSRWWTGSGIEDAQPSNLAHVLLQELNYNVTGQVAAIRLSPVPTNGGSRWLGDVKVEQLQRVVAKAWESMVLLTGRAKAKGVPDSRRRVPLPGGGVMDTQLTRSDGKCSTGMGSCAMATIVGHLQDAKRNGRPFEAITREEMRLDPQYRPAEFVQVSKQLPDKVTETVSYVFRYAE